MDDAETTIWPENWDWVSRKAALSAIPQVPTPGALNLGRGSSWHMTEMPNPCLHCDSLNPGEKLQCTQCGAPLHPMYAVS